MFWFRKPLVRSALAGVLAASCWSITQACSLGPPVIQRPIDQTFFADVQQQNVPAMRQALRRGANVNIQIAPWGLTPLMAAVRGPLATVRLLERHGAEVNLADAHGRTALMKAAYRGNLPVVRSLLRHGARVDASGPQDKTALFYAISTGRPRVVAGLLSAHAQVNRADQYGETPLSLAKTMQDAARAITPQEEHAMTDMRGLPMDHMDSMFMRNRANEIHRAQRVLSLLRAHGATMGRQPAHSVVSSDACQWDTHPGATSKPSLNRP